MKERRKALGLTQAALSVKIGRAADSGTVSKWESGEREPDDLSTLMRAAHALHVSIDWLLGMPEAQEPPLPRLKASVARRLAASATEIVELLVSLTADDEADGAAPPSPPPGPSHPAPRGQAANKRARQRGTA